MKCRKCGKDIDGEFVFCPFCGRKQVLKPKAQSQKEYYKANKDKLIAKHTAWKREHKATISKYPSFQKHWRDYADSLAAYAEAKEQAYQDNLHSETSVFVLTAIDAYEEYKKENK